MARSIYFREKTGPGAWQRAVGTVPFSITGLSNGTVYEVDPGDGTLQDVTPTANANPLAADTAALYWFAPENALASGGVLTSWPDASGNGLTLNQLGTLPMPDWDVGGFARFTGGQAAGLRLAAGSSAAETIAAGGAVCGFAVVRPSATGVAAGVLERHVAVSEANSGTGSNQSHVFGVEMAGSGAGSSRSYAANRRFSNAVLLASNSVVADGALSIVEFELGQSAAHWRLNGAVEASGTPSTGDFASTTTPVLALGARADDGGGFAMGFRGEIHEVFCTANTDAAHLTSLRQTLATKYGVTLT